MLAIVYLLLSFYLGDIVCRRFLPFLSLPHRLAVSLLSGLLISAWWTYLSAVLFSRTDHPLLFGNIVFFLTALGAIGLHFRYGGASPVDYEQNRATGSGRWDGIFIVGYVIVATFLTFATLQSGENSIQPTSRHWSDFGPNVGLIQTFVYGNNFPADNPHFAGELIRHHFLFWFQAANLDYLGLDSAWSINIQSILTIVSMLVLVMVLGEVLFASRAVGRIASALFFFTGSLAYTTFFRSKATWMEAIGEIPGLRIFVQSGYPYAGEAWAIWTVDVFLQQRHFASGIGIFLIALIFIASRQRKWAIMRLQRRQAALVRMPGEARSVKNERIDRVSEAFHEPEFPEGASFIDQPDMSQDPYYSSESPFFYEAQFSEEPDFLFKDDIPDEPDFFWNDDVTREFDLTMLQEEQSEGHSRLDSLVAVDTEQPGPVKADAGPPPEIHYENYTRGFVFAGILMGLLPHWHSAVFLSAGVIFAFWLLFYPQRLQMLYFAAAAGIVSLPQLLFIRAGGMVGSGFPQYKFGYVVLDPTVRRVIEFLGFSLGFKWIFIAIALILAGWFHKRMFVAISSILAITFFVQISPEIVAGHKFINIWLVVANVFVAYGIWRLWHLRVLKQVVLSRIITVVLVFGIIIGGLLDIFPIWNEGSVTALYKDDPLVEWIRANTEPDSVFLSAKYVSHPILMAGRRFYLGYTLYAWSAGLNLKDREMHYKQAFEERSPRGLGQLLVEQGIDYVAIDNDMRKQKKQFYGFNEAIYKKYFEAVYDDTEKRYGLLTIYKVPADPSVLPEYDIIATPADIEDSLAATAFEGGAGKRPGQFINPRGIAVDKTGSIYVADSGNARIQKFGADGKFVSAFGSSGPAEGELVEPNGVAINSIGDILVADAGRHRLLLFNSSGAFVNESAGASRSFFGPRDVVTGPEDQVYVLDQGNSRVVRLDARLGFISEWGTQGTGEGQFREPTGIEIGGQRIFVTDNLNNRVQVFDLEGKFVAAWPVPEWNGFPWHFPDAAYDAADGRLYVTDPIAKQILVFDSNGNRSATLPPPADGALENPSYLSVSVADGRRRLLVLNTGSGRVVSYDLGVARSK